MSGLPALPGLLACGQCCFLRTADRACLDAISAMGRREDHDALQPTRDCCHRPGFGNSRRTRLESVRLAFQVI